MGHLHSLQKLSTFAQHSILALLLASSLATSLQDLQGSCSHGWLSQDFCGSKTRETTCVYKVCVRHGQASVFAEPGPGFTVWAVSSFMYVPAQSISVSAILHRAVNIILFAKGL